MGSDQKLSPEDDRKVIVAEDSNNFAKNFVKDIQNEKSFLDALGDEKKYGLIEEMEAMIKVYNEQLESMCRLRFDVEIYTHLEKEDFTNNKSKISAQGSLDLRRVTVMTIRKQILEKLSK